MQSASKERGENQIKTEKNPKAEPKPGILSGPTGQIADLSYTSLGGLCEEATKERVPKLLTARGTK